MDESIPLEILELYGCMDIIEESLQNGDATTASAIAAKTSALIRNISKSKRYDSRPLFRDELKTLEQETRMLQERAYKARQEKDPQGLDELRDRIAHHLYELENIGELLDTSMIGSLESMLFSHRGAEMEENPQDYIGYA